MLFVFGIIKPRACTLVCRAPCWGLHRHSRAVERAPCSVSVLWTRPRGLSGEVTCLRPHSEPPRLCPWLPLCSERISHRDLPFSLPIDPPAVAGRGPVARRQPRVQRPSRRLPPPLRALRYFPAPALRLRFLPCSFASAQPDSSPPVSQAAQPFGPRGSFRF